MGLRDLLKKAAEAGKKPLCKRCLDRAEACLRVAEGFQRTINAAEETVRIKYEVSLEIMPFVEKWLPSQEDIELAEAHVKFGRLSGKTEKDIQATNLTIMKGLRELEKEWRQGAEAFKERAKLCHETPRR